MRRRDIERAARRAGVEVEAEWGISINAFSGERMWEVAVKREGRLIDSFVAFSSAEVVETLDGSDWAEEADRE